MILSYFLFFILGVIAFFLMQKFNFALQIATAFGVFLIPSIIMTIWLLKIGDKPDIDSVVIVPPVQKDVKNLNQK